MTFFPYITLFPIQKFKFLSLHSYMNVPVLYHFLHRLPVTKQNYKFIRRLCSAP